MARTDRPGESVGGGAKSTGGFSYRASELRPAERRAMAEQNRSAESLKNKNLDAMERGQKAAASRKAGEHQMQEYAYEQGAKNTLKKVAKVAGPAMIAAEEVGRAVGKKQEEKKQGTQSGHAVTNNSNHTKSVSPAEKQANAKRPAVGNDKSAAKKVNGPSWNNGYTN